MIERQPKTGSHPAVKFHMPEYGGKSLDSIPNPEIQMSFGDILWCRVQTDVEGLVTDTPQIIVSSSDKDGNHYYPNDPEGSGAPGDCYVKLLRLDNDGGVPRVKPYQQSDIEHWAQLWTGVDVGGRCRVYKEHMPHDGLWTRLSHRSERPGIGWFSDATTPPWGDWYCLGALFRVSARAIDWWEASAIETREVFTEIAAPSVIARAGGTIHRINRPHHPPLYHCGTMKFNPGHATRTPPVHHPRMFRHPCKYDDASG